MALTANQLAVALFNAAVGGYKSYVDGKLAKGDAAAAGDLLIDSGLASITDNGTFAYALVEKATGGSLTPAQVQQGADVLVGYMNAGMTRAGTVLEVINFLSNPATVNDATFGSAAQLFQNKVVAADASTSTSTDLTVLQGEVATATDFNLTEALADVAAAQKAVVTELDAWGAAQTPAMAAGVATATDIHGAVDTAEANLDAFLVTTVQF